MKNRPKYYILRSILIYTLTLFSGTVISSFILSYFQPTGSLSLFTEDLLVYFVFGLFITSIACIPIFFILIFGFYRIYLKYENPSQHWKNLKGLSIISVLLPLVITAFMALFNFSGWSNLYPWILVMLSYASSGVFFILYISYKADLRNPPEVMKNQNYLELEDILDSGL